MATELLHVDSAATTEVSVHSSVYPPGTGLGDVIAIRPVEPPGNRHRPLLYKVTRLQEDDHDAGKGRRNKLVVHPNVALSFSWAKSRAAVTLSLIHAPPPASLTASHLELYFSNIYLGRADMFRLSLSLASAPLYINQRITLPGSSARLRVGGIYNQEGKAVKSAWVNEDTKTIFRSESARCYVFVEISQEMWQFEEDGSMLREKCEVFLSELFTHWTGKSDGGADRNSKGQNTMHTVSIILYGRVLYENNGDGEEDRAPLSFDEDGVPYRDFYKVILDLTPSPPPSIVRVVSSEIRRWQQDVLLRRRPNGEQKLAGRIAYAHESNVLEAINLALNSFEEHWIDRDLQRTGLSVIILTAGTSYYAVPKGLLRLTTERMLYHGIGLDLISLSKTPLHAVPLFSFKSHEPGLSDNDVHSPHTRAINLDHIEPLPYPHPAGDPGPSSPPNPAPSAPLTSEGLMKEGTSSSRPTNPSLPFDQRDPLYFDSHHPNQELQVYYNSPLFVFCSFFGFQRDKPFRIDRFMPRARCYELFSQGIGDRIPIAIPLLLNDHQWTKDEEGWAYLDENERRRLRRERYDEKVFGAQAIGGGDEWRSWTRRSGATMEISGVSAGNLGGVEERIKVEKEKEKQEKRGKRISLELNWAREETERGRAVAPVALGDAPSSTEPVGPRRGRANSATPSVRTIASTISKADTISSVPTLISRLRPTPAPPTPSAPPSRVGWLGIFKAGLVGTLTPLAPVVSVQKIDVEANARPASVFDTTTFATSVATPASTRPTSNRASSPTPSSRRSSNTLHPEPVIPIPTQPISILARPANKRIPADLPSRAPLGSLRGSIPLATEDPLLDENEVRFNPSKPGKKASEGLADQARRWALIYFRRDSDSQRDVNWVSITRGACLPITTDYLPTAEVLATQYSEYLYSVPTNTASSSFLLRVDSPRRSSAVELVLELVSQRLAYGFQICSPPPNLDTQNQTGDSTFVATKNISQVIRDVQLGEPTAVYLSLANQIHRIAYDRRTQSVVVKILRRRRTWLKTDYTYGALICPLGRKSWDLTSPNFPYPKLIEPLDWQHLDRLVAGSEQPDLRPSLRYWRTRLLLLPADSIPDRDFVVGKMKSVEGNVTDEDINLQGFLMLMDLIQGARWVAPGTEREPTPTEITSLTPPEWAAKVAQESTQAAQATTSGTSESNQTRPARWLRRVAPSGRADSSGRTSVDPQDRSRSPSVVKRPATPITTDTPPTPANSTPTRPTVFMSYSVVLDLDPQKRSDRAERVLCHIDRSHNPLAAYHIELNWLSGSGKIIDAAIQNWTRQVAKYGLALVEVGTRSVFDQHNPFQKHLTVPLAIAPPSQIASSNYPLPKHFYETEILRHLGFFLDIGADETFPETVDVQYTYRRVGSTHSQYIHQSGTLLVSIIGGQDGFAVLPNRIFNSHSNKKPDEIIERLVQFCSDAKQLEEFWKSLGV